MKRRIRPIKKLLVANRGEIAIRVFRAATELGIRTAAIFSQEDKNSLHRYKADEAYLVGRGLGPLRAYLAIDEIVALALKYGVDAIHPGYGFLAENDEFAAACENAGIIFVGPTSKVIAEMGDKVAARKIAKGLGLPMVPGTPTAVDLAGAQSFADKAGYPVILKAAYGGGGRGMRLAHNRKELSHLFAEAERESKSAFGRGDIFVEKYLNRPKHIEVQVLGDTHGNVVHCFERDCSIQRRHQKVVELAPALCFSTGPEGEAKRLDICNAAAELARAISYTNAGTVEFLYEPTSGHFYFMEMNTRIQVEHTVTEVVTGIDLVKSQIRVAEGYALADEEIGIPNQEAVTTRGVAIQCRVTTEDPTANFLPDYGRISAYRSAAGHGIRLDAGNAFTGAVITPYYDSLLVKVTAYGRNLPEASARMDRALAEFRVRGVKTNIPFLSRIMEDADFLNGDCRTNYLDTHPELTQNPPSQDRASKLLDYIGEITVNGNAIVKGTRRPERFYFPLPPAVEKPPEEGTKQILDLEGPKGLLKWIKKQKCLLVTDTTLRDAHQSLLATRMRTHDMVKAARAMASDFPGLFSYEMWGGATYDVTMRFLKESPWERLRLLREAIPNTLFQMLIRGANAVGYTNYPDNVIREFVRLSAEAGIDIFRIFDSLNWLPGMQTAIDAVRKQEKIAEAAICYTGNIEDATRTKYTLKYYVGLAKTLEKAGAHILAIKDMAGLLRPFSARLLVNALKDEINIPIHLHTHDTSGIQGATLLLAAEAGVDIVDCALAPMSGLTSQPNLNSMVAAMQFHRRNTELDLQKLNRHGEYWEEVRLNYAVMESELKAGTATVYDHEMPGGQYTNLRVQAQSMGLGERWPEVVEAYKAANRLFGDIVKVTPSSKVVGDMALFMVANNINAGNFEEKASTLAFPESVIGMMKGNLGQAPGGFPKKVQTAILKKVKPLRGRPGGLLAAVDFVAEKEKLKKHFSARKSGFEIDDRDVISKVLYQEVTLEYFQHREKYGSTSVLPTPVFLYGMAPGEEIEIEMEEGKTLFVKLIAISSADKEGRKTLFFELNGHPRDVQIVDTKAGSAKVARLKADRENLHHLGSPLPGRVVQVAAKAGQQVKKGDPLFVLEAMKMETSVASPMDGLIKEVLAKGGDTVETGDLLAVFQ